MILLKFIAFQLMLFNYFKFSRQSTAHIGENHICNKLVHGNLRRVHIRSFTYVRRSPLPGFKIAPNKFDLLLVEGYDVYNLTVNKSGPSKVASLVVPEKMHKWTEYFRLDSQNSEITQDTSQLCSVNVFNAEHNYKVEADQPPGHQLLVITKKQEYLWSRLHSRILHQSARIHAHYSLVLDQFNRGFVIQEAHQGDFVLYGFYYRADYDQLGTGHSVIQSLDGSSRVPLYFYLEFTDDPHWINLVPRTGQHSYSNGLFHVLPSGFLVDRQMYLIDTQSKCVYSIEMMTWEEMLNEATTNLRLPLRILPIEQLFDCQAFRKVSNSLDYNRCLSRWTNSFNVPQPKVDDPSSEITTSESSESQSDSDPGNMKSTLSNQNNSGQLQMTDKPVGDHWFFTMCGIVSKISFFLGTFFLLIFVVVVVVVINRSKKRKIRSNKGISFLPSHLKPSIEPLSSNAQYSTTFSLSSSSSPSSSSESFKSAETGLKAVGTQTEKTKQNVSTNQKLTDLSEAKSLSIENSSRPKSSERKMSSVKSKSMDLFSEELSNSTKAQQSQIELPATRSIATQTNTPTSKSVQQASCNSSTNQPQVGSQANSTISKVAPEKATLPHASKPARSWSWLPWKWF